jgi:hypothetical protein
LAWLNVTGAWLKVTGAEVKVRASCGMMTVSPQYGHFIWTAFASGVSAAPQLGH